MVMDKRIYIAEVTVWLVYFLRNSYKSHFCHLAEQKVPDNSSTLLSGAAAVEKGGMYSVRGDV